MGIFIMVMLGVCIFRIVIIRLMFDSVVLILVICRF